jgi:inhibitor of growth protein 4
MKKSYLEDSIEKAATLPNDMYKGMTLLRELDEKVNQRLSAITRLVENDQIDSKTLEERHKEILILADEKIATAVNCYDLIDKMIKIVDENLAKFNQEGVVFKQEEPAAKRKKQAPPTPPAQTVVLEKRLFETEIPLDPNEPVYCYCKKVSHGQMVCCDNEDCDILWYHFGCVGLTQAPQGEWFCPECTKKLK